MLRADILIDTTNAELENTEEAFDAVGGHVAGHVLVIVVINSLVTRKARTSLAVERRAVGHQTCTRCDLAFRQRLEGVSSDSRDVEGTNAALAFNQRHNLLLLAAMTAFAKASGLAEGGFVRFYNPAAARATEHIALTISHGQTDAMTHEPCGLEGHTQSAMELVSADAFLAGGDQVDCLQPQMQGNVTVFEDNADANSEGLAALIALVNAKASAITFQLANTLHRAATWARSAIWPDACFNEGEGRFFVVEVRG